MMHRKLFLFIIFGLFGLVLTGGTALATDHAGPVCNETWGPGDNPHYVIGNITVAAGCTLEILPGTEVYFKGNYYIRVDGEMLAEGTSASPILFTRFDDTLAYWSQLFFRNSGTGSFAYCTIEYAANGINLGTDTVCRIDHCKIQYCYSNGIYYYQIAVDPGHIITNNMIRNNRTYGAYFYGVTDVVIGSGNAISNNKYGIFFYNCINPQVAAGNTIERNLDYGVHFVNSSQPALLSGVSECGVGVIYENCSGIGTIDNLTFTKNSEAAVQVKNSGPFTLGSSNTITDNGWPLAIDVGSFPDPAGPIPTAGNLRNAIQIVAGSGDKTGTWPNFTDIDYVLTGNNTIQGPGFLTLSPGITVLSHNGMYIRIDGKLNAVGTSEERIRFTRLGADSWGGLRFHSGSQGEVRHACIEYGYYGVYLNQTASVPVSDCLFRHNDHGLYIAAGASVQVERSSFHYNDYGAYFAAGGTGTVGDTEDNFCCFKGNRQYAVQNNNAFTIIGQYNYWGDPDGPNHPSNLIGKGDRVSNNVDFLPYADACLSYDECISERCTSQIQIPAGCDVTYTWEVLDGGTIVGSGNSVVFDPPDRGPHPCPYRVQVTMTSSASGLSTSETIGIDVKLAGDADGNGMVNVLDKVLVRNHFGETPADPGWDPRADVDCNGTVNVLDKTYVRNQFGDTGCACPVP